MEMVIIKKTGKTFFKVYVQFQNNKHRQLSFQKLRKDIDSRNGTWTDIDITFDFQEMISELKNSRLNRKYVLPEYSERKHGDAGKVLRMFLDHIGINKDVVFHTLRGCFAIHLLSTGVESLKVMRMSEVDVKGVAEGLDVLPDRCLTDKGVPLFR